MNPARQAEVKREKMKSSWRGNQAKVDKCRFNFQCNKCFYCGAHKIHCLAVNATCISLCICCLASLNSSDLVNMGKELIKRSKYLLEWGGGGQVKS